jgi:hypothetical protein
MPTTTVKGFPYPIPGDPLGDADIFIKDLAEFLEVKGGLHATGTATIVFTASSNSFVDVVYPVGRFGANVPVVMATMEHNSGAFVPYVINRTAAGFRVGANRALGALSGSFNVSWHAVYAP